MNAQLGNLLKIEGVFLATSLPNLDSLDAIERGEQPPEAADLDDDPPPYPADDCRTVARYQGF